MFGLGLGMKGGASGFRLQCVFCGAIAISVKRQVIQRSL